MWSFSEEEEKVAGWFSSRLRPLRECPDGSFFFSYVAATGSYCFTLSVERLHITSSWICSALSFSLSKPSTAACAFKKAHILLARVRLTLLYTRLPCKKKKRILSAEVFFYHAVVSRSGGNAGQSQCEGSCGRARQNVIFHPSDADSFRLTGSFSEAAEWVLIPDNIQRLLIFYHHRYDFVFLYFLLEFYVSIKRVFALDIQPKHFKLHEASCRNWHCQMKLIFSRALF